MIQTNNFNFLTQDKKFNSSKSYKIIENVLSNMVHYGILSLGAGYCISTSDMVRTALKNQGIDSKLVECTLTITHHTDKGDELIFVGFPGIKNPGELDTHVVVITDTEVPFLIDASISHKLPPRCFAVIEPLSENSTDLLTQRYIDSKVSLTYMQKHSQTIPIKYQESILERIDTDRKVFENLKFLKILISIALAIGIFNAARGLYDFYSVYYLDNSWGPKSMEKIYQRLQSLEDNK